MNAEIRYVPILIHSSNVCKVPSICLEACYNEEWSEDQLLARMYNNQKDCQKYIEEMMEKFPEAKYAMGVLVW